MTVKELKAAAKEKGLRGYSKLRKAELEKLLSIPGKFSQNCASLKAAARAAGIKGWYRMRKAELVAALEAVKPVDIEAEVMAELAEMTATLEESKALTRIMTGKGTQNDVLLWKGRRLRALKELRDSAETEKRYKAFAGAYMVTAAGVHYAAGSGHKARIGNGQACYL